MTARQDAFALLVVAALGVLGFVHTVSILDGGVTAAVLPWVGALVLFFARSRLDEKRLAAALIITGAVFIGVPTISNQPNSLIELVGYGLMVASATLLLILNRGSVATKNHS